MNSREPKEEPNDTGVPQKLSGDSMRHVSVVDNRIDSRELFIATREIIIGHGDDTYRLRLTAQNKLILTK